MSAARGSNRLPTLAAEIKRAHKGVFDAAKTAAERCIEAGHALLEAKALLKHGEWLPWLKNHCELPERTAQLYMKIAKSGLESATVADIGLRAAGKVMGQITNPGYDPFAICDEADKRDWHLFILWLNVACGYEVDGAECHTEWILQRQFKNPAEWMGSEGDEFRKRSFIPLKMPRKTVKGWHTFYAAHEHRTLADIVSELKQRAGIDAAPDVGSPNIGAAS